jgi:hypothetical protein
MKIPAQYFEINITGHCNLKCDQCSHYSPYVTPGFYDLKQFEIDIGRLTEVYHARMIRLLGGEPLLNKNLPQYVRIVRAKGLADLVGICTNGILLAHVPDELLIGLDFVYVSVYPFGEKFLKDLENGADKCRRLGIKLGIERKDTVRLMNVDDPHDEELPLKIFRSCKIANLWRCHTIYNGFFYKCSRPIFMRHYFARRGIKNEIDYQWRDGVDLHHPLLFERLEAYLLDHNPFLSCSYCLGTSGKSVPWRQMGQDERVAVPTHPLEWLEVSELEKIYI